MSKYIIDTPSKLVINGETDIKNVALTYDCGFEYGKTVEILEVLNKYNIKATFFITGLWVERFPKLAKGLIESGHEIGNHSYDHPDMTLISREEIIDSIYKTEKIIEKALGINPRPLFREPYGAWNDTVLQAVHDAGYDFSIYWSIDTLDWQQPPPETIADRILSKVRGGDIILMHVHGVNTPLGSEIAIKKLRDRGYEFTTVSKLLV